MKKRLLIVLLGTALMISTLLGCGDKPETPSTEKNTEQTTEAQREDVVVSFGDTEQAEKESSDKEKAETSETEVKSENNTEKQENKEDDTPEVAASYNAWTTSTVNMRQAATTDSEVLLVLKNRDALSVIAEKGDWVKVLYDDKEGYVNKSYITTEEPVYAAANNRVIVIDPGHQLYGDSTQEPNGPGSGTMKARVTGGTTGRTTGVTEYQLNLTIGLLLRDELVARGYTVYMTRETHEVNISNMERAQYATTVGADIAVRIHANGCDNSAVSGALALAPSTANPYISYLAADSQRLSQCVLNSYCAATGFANQGVQASDTMTGMNWSTVPVTILEMGYMTNPSDDTNMQDPGMQARMVQGIADGIDAYYQ